MFSCDLLVTMDKSCWAQSLKLCSCCLLCAGEDLLSLSDDVDEGCQWELQRDEGWTLYWDPQA
jgi:hypothetical protein